MGEEPDFLWLCKHEKERLDRLEESAPSLDAVELRLDVRKLRWLAGLDLREERYVDQLWGFTPFTPLKQVELAKQDRLTPPAITKRVNSITRKLKAAVYLSQLQPVERLQAFLR